LNKEQGSGLGTLCLLALTVIVVICAFALGGYAVGAREAAALQQAGFTHWGGSVLSADIGLDCFNSPASSVWYRYAPGARLDFAFIYAPELRAAVAGGGVFVAALFIAVLAAGWQRWPSVLRFLAIIIVWGGVCLGVLPLIGQAPSSFGVDMQRGMLSDAVLQPGDLVALSSVTGFGDDYLPGRWVGGHSMIFADRNDGTQFILTELNGVNEAAPLVNMLQIFVSTKGQQL
jgi:hypothetical protein